MVNLVNTLCFLWLCVLSQVAAQLAGTPPQCALPCVVPDNYPGCSSQSSSTACLCTNPTLSLVQSCITHNCSSTSAQLQQGMTFLTDECASITGQSGSVSGQSPSTTTSISNPGQATDASIGNTNISLSNTYRTKNHFSVLLFGQLLISLFLLYIIP